MSQRLKWLILIAGVTGCLALLQRPYHDGMLRFGLPVSLAWIWAGALLLGWPGKAWRMVVLAVPVLAVAPFCLPGKAYHREELRDHYVAAMKDLEGSPYRWGGECAQGIDCSGLPRRGLRVALLQEGVQHGNGAAFREWARQWWYDTSAKAMAEGYRGFTQWVGISGRLKDLDVSLLQPGDLAVTAGRQHVMVYAGNGEWIQADPRPDKVVLEDPRQIKNPWFISMVTVHRWSVLE